MNLWPLWPLDGPWGNIKCNLCTFPPDVIVIKLSKCDKVCVRKKKECRKEEVRRNKRTSERRSKKKQKNLGKKKKEELDMTPSSIQFNSIQFNSIQYFISIILKRTN